jgi:GLPGLI family protein
MITIKVKLEVLLIAAVCITISQGLFGQEIATLNVIYELRYIRDMSQKDVPFTSNMILVLGKNTSRYCSERFYRENNSSNKNMENQVQSQVSPQPATVVVGGPMLRIGKYGVDIEEEVMKDFAKQKMETVGLIASKTYLVKTDLPRMDWQLKDERKNIGKYSCQKAVGKYAGREYEAWFAPELPSHDGPWKLNGLPGLILEAHDVKNEVVFTFKEISRYDEATETIISYLLKAPDVVETNLKNYNRLRAAFDSDPEGILLAEHPDVSIYLKTVDGSNVRKVNKLKKYNPIEIN